MIELVETGNALTMPVEEVVIQAPMANNAMYDAFCPFTGGGATNVVFTANFSHDQFTSAINEWQFLVNTGASTSYTYADTTGAGVVTLTASTSPLTTNNTGAIGETVVLYDTGGWPPRVGATFTVTSGTSVTTWPNGADPVPLERKEVGGFTVWVPRELTDEEKAERAARAAEYERQQRVWEAEKRLADTKAEVLLRKVLTPKQRAEMEEQNAFHVWGKDGFKYRIKRGYGHNVSQLCPETGKVLRELCVVPRLSIPEADRLLAQKLMLEADAPNFVKLANVRELLKA